MSGATPPSLSRAISFGALVSAARVAARGKAVSMETARFLLEVERECLALRAELEAGTYAPQPYRTFSIRDPKPRLISAAAFRDRVVHHALCAEIVPWLERGAHPDSYACRVGKGQRRALRRAQSLARSHGWVMKLDIEHFFETMPHAVLLRLLRRRLRHDPGLVWLCERFVRAGAPGSSEGRGVPIGNLTSQHFANFFLGPLDRLLSNGLRVSFVRYMDDVLVFAHTEADLWEIHAIVSQFVTDRLGVRLKARATRVMPVRAGVPFLGFRLFPHLLPLDGARRRRLHRTLRRLVRAPAGSEEAAQLSASSVVGWAAHGSTTALRRAFMDRAIPPEQGSVSSRGSNRVNRGGSWNNNAQNARAANRNNNTPGNQNNNLGLRLASTGNTTGDGRAGSASPTGSARAQTFRPVTTPTRGADRSRG